MEAFIQSLQTKSAALAKQAAELRGQDKGDEAVFCTVRANVYDICATVCRVHLDRGNVSAAEAILVRFENEWSAALENARRRDDAKGVCVGEAKLEALCDVRARFAAVRCE